MRISDCSSDVCSSDLHGAGPYALGVGLAMLPRAAPRAAPSGRFPFNAACTKAWRHVRKTASAPRHPGLSAGPRTSRGGAPPPRRSEEHTSELQSLLRTSYAVFCWKKKTKDKESILTSA